MNIDKELETLAKKEQALRARFGAKFRKYYNALIDGIASNNMVISSAEASNIRMQESINEVMPALQITGTEV